MRRRSLDALFAAFGSDESALSSLEDLYIAKLAELRARLPKDTRRG
jgi:hypothetical protein